MLAFIDLDTLRLPNVLVALVAAGGGIGVAVSLITGEPVVPLVEGGGALASPLLFALLGALASAGVALAIAAAYARLRKAEGFGMGDVKLLAAIGVYLGLYGLMVLFFASLIGAVVAVLATRGRAGAASARVPFGPFLALSAVLVTLVGPALWAWYLGFLA